MPISAKLRIVAAVLAALPCACTSPGGGTGCGPDASGGKGVTGSPGGRTARTDFSPSPQAGVMGLADAAPPPASLAARLEGKDPEPAGPEFLTWPPEADWPRAGMEQQPTRTRLTAAARPARRPVRIAARTAPTRARTAAVTQQSMKAKPVAKLKPVPPASPPRATAAASGTAPARPRMLTEIPRPGSEAQQSADDSRLDILRDRIEESARRRRAAP